MVKPKRKKAKSTELPKYTYGLEGKLLGLIGEPILLAQRIVRPKFEQELSTNVGTDIRHTYHTQKHIRYFDYDVANKVFPWDDQADKIFHTTIPSISRAFNFRVDLWENSYGKLTKFSFALEVGS
jgi:hypothetical protein